MTHRHETAIKEIKLRASRARELADSLDNYAKAMEDDREVKVGTRMEWAINEIENFLRNINFAGLARYRAALLDE